MEISLPLLILTGLVCSNANTTGLQGVIGDFHDLFDLIPYETLVPLYINYAIEDKQVRKILRYMRSECFKANLKSLQRRRQFNETAEFLKPLGVNLHKLVNDMYQLDRYPQLSDSLTNHHQSTYNHNDDGLLGLIEQTVELLPMQDIKELYKDKLDSFEFRNVVEQRYKLKELFYGIVSTEECEFVSNQLFGMGVPLKDVIAFLEEETTNFFDLEYISDRESSDEYDDDDDIKGYKR
ncbi:protein G12-like [Lycorma delicatula]|uniref:protein G12-like n=1 Tax=Lycorma delicatula TaxID=130591 RepID=UPI003F518CCD